MNTLERLPIEEIYRSLTSAARDTAVSVILKLRGETCNIDCLYCYEKRKETPGGARIDAADVHRLAEIFGDRPLAVELHGGEPLTAGHDHVREVLQALAALPTVVRVSMQTNGILLDEAWLDLFDATYPDLQIGISLDGDPEANAWRVGYDGQGTHGQVAAALHLLATRGRKTGVIAAVTGKAVGRAEAILDHLAGFRAVTTISFVPCFDTTVIAATASPTRRQSISRILQQAAVGDRGPDWATTPQQYADFVLAATGHWVSTGLFSRIKLEPAVSTIRQLRGAGSGFCHFSDLKCDHVFTLYPSGRFGSCDELPWPQAGLPGLTLLTDEPSVAAAQRGSVLLTAGKALMGKCTTCTYRPACGGGCVATRWRMHQVGSDEAYCDYRMRLVDGIAALLADPSHLHSLWCTKTRWRPRTPNAMGDVNAFLSRWDNPTADRPPVALLHSEHGNINTVGQPGIHEADDLDPHHRQWQAAIEPGIWPLVDAVTRSWGAVTYDSCEGHPYPGLPLPPAPRRLGILPRDRREYSLLATALCRAVTAVAEQVPVAVVIGRAELTSRTDGTRRPVLDLLLEPHPGQSWPDYFANIDAATALLSDAIAGLDPRAGGNCPCQCGATAR